MNVATGPAALAAPRGRSLRAYGLALLVSGAVLALLVFVAQPVLPPPLMPLALLLATTVAASYGGLGPGLVATALCAGAIASGMAPAHDAMASAGRLPGSLVGSALFVAVGVTISLLSHRLHVALRQAERRREELEHALGDGRHGEAALRASEERFRLAAEAVDGLIYEQDMSSDRVIRTRGLLELTGWAPDEVPPTADWWLAQVHPDDRAGIMETFLRVRDAGLDRVEVRYRIRHRDGRWVHVVDRAIMMRDDRGPVRRLVGCSQDVSAQEEAQAALRAADRRKDAFIATLAHELRNPMAPLRNGLALLRRTGMHGAPAGLLDTMDRQLVQLVHLVDDLLDAGRISHDKLRLRQAPMRLDDALDSALEAVHPALEASGHRLEVRRTPDPVVLHADLTRVAQILSNLLGNAIKYTPRGGHIRVRTVADTHTVSVRVEDDGIGLAPEAVEQVFGLFAQAPGGDAHAQGGLGIGLALSRRLAELHGGTLTGESEGPGRGCAFTLRLPRHGGDAPPGAA